jgi:type I restriction enzyme S subunit
MEKELPLGWVNVVLEDMYSHVTGGDWGLDPQTDDLVGFSKVLCIRGGELRNWRVDKGKTASIRLVKDSSINTRRLKIGDILLEISGGGPDQPVGRTVIIDEEVLKIQPELPKICTNFLRLVRLVDLVNKEYINQYLQYFYGSGEVVKYQGGSNNLRNLKFGDYSSIEIPLPPFSEQQRIVAKLNSLFGRLDRMKTSMERIPQLLKDFRQKALTQAVTGKLTEEWREGKEFESGLSLVLKNRLKFYNEKVRIAKKCGESKPKKLEISEFEYFSYEDNYTIPSSWELANLKNIADLITDGEHLTPKRTDQGKYLLSARNVQNGYISLEKVDYVPIDEYERLRKRCSPEFNDVLISCSGTIGRVSIVPRNLEFVMVRSAALVKLQSNTESSKYFEYALRSSFAQEQMLVLQKSTAQANLFIGPIGQIVLPVPPIEEQQEVVRRVESLFAKADQIEASYKNLKAKIEQLPQALLSKAFRGELVEQLPTDGDARDLLEQIKKAKAGLEKGGKSKKLGKEEPVRMVAEEVVKYKKRH